jgi:hypothetical protein
VACVAKGNPVPSVKVTLPDGEIQKGQGEVKVVIPTEWEAMSKFIHCEASNEVEGKKSSHSLNYTFTVASEYYPLHVLGKITYHPQCNETLSSML